MPKYPKSLKFPIVIFNAFNSTPKFRNFKGYFNHFKQFNRESKFSFQSLPMVKSSDEFISKSSFLFPYIFFVRDKIYEDSNLLRNLINNPIIKDGNGLMALFATRLDLRKIIKNIDEIQRSEDAKFNAESFTNDLLECLYKYASYKLLDFVFVGGSNSTAYTKLLLDFMQLKIGENNSSEWDSINEYLKYSQTEIISDVEKSFRIANYNPEELNIHIKLVSSNSNFIMWLYSIIDNNIRYADGLSQNKKNKIIRPMFHEIIGTFVDNNWRELDSDDPKFVSAQRDFISRYNKYF
jgi:hypothetical protein